MCVCVCVCMTLPLKLSPLGVGRSARARARMTRMPLRYGSIRRLYAAQGGGGGAGRGWEGGGGGGGGGGGWPSHDPDNDPPGSITQDPGRRAKEPAGTGRMMAEEEEEGEGEGIEEGDCVSERQRWDGGSGNGGKPSWER